MQPSDRRLMHPPPSRPAAVRWPRRGGAQAQPVEEGPAAVEEWQAHHVVDAQPRLAGEGAAVERRLGRSSATPRRRA